MFQNKFGTLYTDMIINIYLYNILNILIIYVIKNIYLSYVITISHTSIDLIK